MARKKKKEPQTLKEKAVDIAKKAAKDAGKAALKTGKKFIWKRLKKKLGFNPRRIKGSAVLSRDVHLIAQGMMHRWFVRTTAGIAAKGGPGDYDVGWMAAKKGYKAGLTLRGASPGELKSDSGNEEDYFSTWDGKIPNVVKLGPPPPIPLEDPPDGLDKAFMMFRHDAEQVLDRLAARLKYKSELALRRRPNYRTWLTRLIASRESLLAADWGKAMLKGAMMWTHTRRGPQIISTRKSKAYGPIKFGGRQAYRRKPGRPRREENWQQSPP